MRGLTVLSSLFQGPNQSKHLRMDNSVVTIGESMFGIKNHGNTCFMNAILQCLSHTDLLAEYFVMNHYKIDLVKNKQINLCKYGSHGEVTCQCALLFKSLWTNNYSPEISNKFKHLVSKYCKQYEGSDQHDAQEFLFFLLDIFHEDLNIATKRKSKKLKQIQKNWNKSDELIAAETLAYHKRCDSSFIHDLFQAQLRSSLVCRSCNNYSNTFDPYMCLSIPVPIKRTQTVIINVSYLDNITKIVRMVVTIEAQATLRELRDKISRLVKIPERQMVLLVVENGSELKELIKDKLTMHEILDDIDNVEVEAIETPLTPTWGAENYSTLVNGSSTSTPTRTPSSLIINNSSTTTTSSSSSSLSSSSSPHPPSQQPPSSQPLTLLWINRVGIGSENKVFGPFFSISLPRESSFKEIQHNLMKKMSPILRKTCDLAIVKDSTLFRLKVIDGLPGKCYLPEDVDHPLYMPTVDKALSNCEQTDYRGPIHLKLIIEWDLDLRQTLLVDDDDLLTVIDDPNIEFIKVHNEMANTATLKDCLDMYFREERLGADNAWMCPACKRRQQCIKKLSLWSTPDIFIIHLKRFRQASNSLRTKLTTLVTFPFSGLDMNPYLSNRNNYNNHLNNNKHGVDTVDFVNNNNQINSQIIRNSSGRLPSPWRRPSRDNYNNQINNSNSIRNSTVYLPSPWRRPSRSTLTNNNTIVSGFPKHEDNIYNLYAVCNHHGNMSAGHYDAYCRNVVDGKWYSFDDQIVTPILERSVVTSDAYILFYQRSTLSPQVSSCSSSSSSTNGSSSTTSSNSSSTISSSASSSNRPIDHWTYHLAPQIKTSTISTSISNRSSPSSAKSSDNLSSSSSHHGSDSSHKRDHNGKTNHSNQLSRGARAYSTLPSRKPSDSAKSSLKDSRPISPPIKRSQNIYSSMSLSKSRSNHLIDKIKSTHSPQESHQQQLSRPKSLSSNLHRHPGTINNSNGPLSSPSHHTKGIDAIGIGRSPRFRDDLFSCFVGILS